jgi:phage-related protein
VVIETGTLSQAALLKVKEVASLLDGITGENGEDDRRAIGLDLMRVQFGWPIGRPLVGSLKNGLWEVRSTLPSRRIARLILCFHDEVLIVLHGFIEKTQKTSADDLAWQNGE